MEKLQKLVVVFAHSFGCSRNKIHTQTINPPGPVLATTHGKDTKSCSFNRTEAAVVQWIIHWPCKTRGRRFDAWLSVDPSGASEINTHTHTHTQTISTGYCPENATKSRFILRAKTLKYPAELKSDYLVSACEQRRL